MKGLVELTAEAISHNGFSFLNVMSPCVTWRGDDQFKVMKEQLAYLPEDYDPARRASSTPYTRETGKITTGVLYEVQTPTLVDRLEEIKQHALDGKPAPSTHEILQSFYPPE
jgi:2-oxoglutarate ferredoxin oxidoreductase subunit beta